MGSRQEPGSGRPAGRARRCLLKGCERWFSPTRPQSRYCSDSCGAAAKRWRRAKASRRYRASLNGQKQRREQHRRYRQQRRQRAVRASADEAALREGQRPASPNEDFPERQCDRPGCYVTFVASSPTSCRRFCSVACRLALRRVLDREARHRQRRRRWRKQFLNRRIERPDTS
jgi:hypothetical protein